MGAIKVGSIDVGAIGLRLCLAGNAQLSDNKEKTPTGEHLNFSNMFQFSPLHLQSRDYISTTRGRQGQNSLDFQVFINLYTYLCAKIVLRPYMYKYWSVFVGECVFVWANTFHWWYICVFSSNVFVYLFVGKCVFVWANTFHWWWSCRSVRDSNCEKLPTLRLPFSSDNWENTLRVYLSYLKMPQNCSINL